MVVYSNATCSIRGCASAAVLGSEYCSKHRWSLARLFKARIRLFGTKKSSRTAEHAKSAQKEVKDVSSESFRLRCAYCGEVYLIGEDAFLVTDDDILATVQETGGELSTWGGMARRAGPDLAMRYPTERAIPERLKVARKEERMKAARICSALTRGQPRSWLCNKCNDANKVNRYPDDWG
jgi:rubrerythrin